MDIYNALKIAMVGQTMQVFTSEFRFEGIPPKSPNHIDFLK